MTQSFDRLVERQIQKAIAEGQLSGLKGEGTPLTINSNEAFVDVAMAVAGRIMAEAGALPEEFQIKKRQSKVIGMQKERVQSALRWP
ncbi:MULTISPECIES: DUF1992 domain-containing protein [Rhodobacterales]|uniref:DnaJ family domain-containing protein n=1 Tax=Rhodobacterales TaxID=204455 RepID=UPI0026D13514